MAKLTNLAPRVATLDTRTAQPGPKEADPHYSTPEHRQWRAIVIARAGGRCEGIVNGHRCGRAERRMFADHIVERKDGGAEFDPANGQCLCGSCHSRKTAAARAQRMKA